MGQNDDDRSAREIIREKLRQNFDGKIVRKDLTKHIKEGANVPVYVLEFLLGQYCSTDDEETIAQGVQNVKRILADNFVRPDEAEKIKAVLRKNGNHTVIREHIHTFGETYATITQIQRGGCAMRTVGVILLTVLRFTVMLFVGVFLFLVKLALGGR